MKVSSAIFQRTLEEISKSLDSVIVLQNDILVYADDPQSLKVRLQNLSNTLGKRNVVVRCATEVVFWVM